MSIASREEAGTSAPSPPTTHRPLIPAAVNLPELTPLPLILGTLLGIVFGAASLYLVLKVGLTVSASIPVAVLSITIFRVLSRFGLRQASILENNIVQTAGSAGESLAFGVGVTMPAILILGFDLDVTRVMLVAVLGGLLGILMMIPLRRALIVDQHAQLKYPEGTACAEVLKAGATREELALGQQLEPGDGAAPSLAPSYAGARMILGGFAIGLVYKTLNVVVKLWKDIPERVFGAPYTGASVAAEISPELLGVGYIIGPRIASIMCSGGVLAYLVLIPAIKLFGAHAGIVPPGTMPISEMAPDEVRGAYILYIGAGAVAAGGIISLFGSLPTIWHGLKEGLSDLQSSKSGTRGKLPRTEQDLSFRLVIGGSIALIGLIMAFPQLQMNLLGAILIVVFGFLFVTVSSRLTGEIGSSSTPNSGMTVATLLFTCLLFLLVGWTGPSYYVTALSVGAIVCVASSNGGTTSQDLKTGFLIGSTPRSQQIAILVGSLASALTLGPILLSLNQSSTVYVPHWTFGPPPASAALPAATASGLPPFTAAVPVQLGGNLHQLRVATGAASPAPGLAAGNYLVDGAGRFVATLTENFGGSLRAPLAHLGATEALQGPQARQDAASYRVWQKTDDHDGPPGRYLVGTDGTPAYLVDPGINGTHAVRPDGSRVAKFDAPKATLMSYIIKGILNRQLPWGLVLLGVLIAIVLEMAGIPSLPFAVGVYLPLSSSSPIFIGGLARALVDRGLRRRGGPLMSEEELNAEADKSPGVLLASGYIAGGAIAGIGYALMASVLSNVSDRLEQVMQKNPFYGGPHADLLALLPFVVLVLLLVLSGRPPRRSARGGTRS
jgi:putative OPT family oligopeptide transporter